MLTLPEILGLFLDGFCTVSLDLSSLIFLDLISTDLWVLCIAYINWKQVLDDFWALP